MACGTLAIGESRPPFRCSISQAEVFRIAASRLITWAKIDLYISLYLYFIHFGFVIRFSFAIGINTSLPQDR
jgi:hypothetical protein